MLKIGKRVDLGVDLVLGLKHDWRSGEGEDLGEIENEETNRRLWFCLYIER